MEKFLSDLRGSATNNERDFAYNEISNHYNDYSKLELANIIKEMLFAISKVDNREEILLDVADGLEDIYDIYEY